MSTTETVVLVTGMTCEHCAHAVRGELIKLAGVRDIAVDVASGEVIVHADAPLDPGEVLAAVEEAGYGVDR